MQIELSAQLHAYIIEKVNSGLYSNESEVIRDALRHMMTEDTDLVKAQNFRAAVQVGLDQLERGEGAVWSVALRQQLADNVQRKSQEGRRPKTDVCP
ncbi:MAG: type II toxin-antitoxin system ParD family antitoxin [Chloroflexaceae bacterium]|jgi:antitoxin ParD1/3/4|nr:type II toxin-antitoxin system ParD family antitoxin [Chloroflexaceae bacterium]